MSLVHRTSHQDGGKKASPMEEPDSSDGNAIPVDPLNISSDSDVVMCDTVNSPKDKGSALNSDGKDKAVGQGSSANVDDLAVGNQSTMFTEVVEIPDVDIPAEDEASKRKKRKESKPKEAAAAKKANVKSRVGRPPTASSKLLHPTSKVDTVVPAKASAAGDGVTAKASKKVDKTGNITSRRLSQTSAADKKGGALLAENKVGSPKPSYKQAEEEARNDAESSGPKVPPLKIVIPGGIGAASSSGGQSDDALGNRKGKGGRSSLPHKKCSISIPLEAAPSIVETVLEKDKRPSEENLPGAGGPRILRSHRSSDGSDREKLKDRNSPLSNTSLSPNPQFIPLPAKSPPPLVVQETEPVTQSSDSPTAHQPVAPAVVQAHEKPVAGASSSASPPAAPASNPAPPVKLPPRKRKVKTPKEHHDTMKTAANADAANPHTGQTNSFQMYFNIRKQIERRQKGVFPVQPKPPKGFKDYLMNRCSYVLQKNVKMDPTLDYPQSLPALMREEFALQEKDRHNLRVQHQVEKEKLVLAVEQEILRVHGRAARALANQALPFSACTFLRGREVYNMLSPEQEEKERNAQRPRYNGRLFLSWLQEVDDKWEKIKEGMVRRHHNEAESLHAVQTMNWEWRLKELGLCDSKTAPTIDNNHVPIVLVSEDFDLLPD